MQAISKIYGTRLTRREQQVLSFVSLGYGTRQIASELSISENTVANHRKNVLRKRGARTLKQLMKRNLANLAK